MRKSDIFKCAIGATALAGLLFEPVVHAQAGSTGGSNQESGTSSGGSAAVTGRPSANTVELDKSSGASVSTSGATSSRNTDAAQNAYGHIDKAVRVMHTMESDPALRTALQQAQGVFIVPDYGRVALGVGARGGAGVLFAKRDGKWVNPAFYTLGGISAGAQAGIEGGSIAMILNNQKALNSFKQDNNFSLNADAGLTIVAWSAKAQGSAGKGDITMWSDTKGLFGDLAISATDIHFDVPETRAYYGQQVASAKNVIEGRVKNPHATTLQRALAALPSANEPGMPATGSGSSSTGGAGASGSSGTTGGTPSGESGQQPAR
jgi:lipid-binding SYLF domain-containing protein